LKPSKFVQKKNGQDAVLMTNGEKTGENQEQTQVVEQEGFGPPRTKKEWDEWELVIS
jgi:hypothetical protein